MGSGDKRDKDNNRGDRNIIIEKTWTTKTVVRNRTLGRQHGLYNKNEYVSHETLLIRYTVTG